MSLENQINGLILDSIPQENLDGTYSFQVLERCWDRDVSYIKNVSANSVSFEVAPKGYRLHVLEGTFKNLEEKAKLSGSTFEIYPKFNKKKGK